MKGWKKYWIEIIGILIGIGIIYVWYGFFYFNDGELWEKRGQMGDSFGVLNTLFSGLAFAGIVFTIFLQRKELSLQRNELKLTREEFTTNRLTNILYQQINIQQKAISDFSISPFDIKSGKYPKYSGNSAFLYLYKEIDLFLTPIDDERTEEQLLNDKINHYKKSLSRYAVFDESFLDFTTRTINSVTVVKNILGNSNLENKEMKLFVDLFFDNIGYAVNKVLDDVNETFYGYIDLEKADQQYIDFGRMGLVNINLNGIIKLKNFDFERDRDEVIKDLLK